ncbi:MAM and LDL-receptor class A domain-containing protein 2 [Trichonephila clavipes]|nr:MAM and LDL-receptor class A domain-containing protein 2 [Trichonephila clavipes]
MTGSRVFSLTCPLSSLEPELMEPFSNQIQEVKRERKMQIRKLLNNRSYYMNLLSNPQAPQRGGTRAWLISPLFSATGRTRCLSFYYFMYERSIDPAGPSLGSLRVHVKSAAGEAGGKITTLWRLHNHQGQRWQTARTPVVMGSERAAPSSPYQIIIEGIWGMVELE